MEQAVSVKRITVDNGAITSGSEGHVYVQIKDGEIRKGEVQRSDELIEGRVFADYDKDGQLLGIEII